MCEYVTSNLLNYALGAYHFSIGVLNVVVGGNCLEEVMDRQKSHVETMTTRSDFQIVEHRERCIRRETSDKRTPA